MKKKPKKSMDPNEDREMDNMMNGLGEVVQKKDKAHPWHSMTYQ